MKNIKRTLLVSLVPFLTPLTAIADTEKQLETVTPIPGTKVSADSWRASQVLGLNVKNAGDETIGDVEDLVLDMKNGEIIAVVISSGGFLGMGDTLSAVPVSALRYDDRAKAFKTKLTKEQLGKAPNFKSNAWPNYNDDASRESLRSYRGTIGDDVTGSDNVTDSNGVTSRDNAANRNNAANRDKAISSDSSTDSDNTRHNRDEVNRDAANPTDQGNSTKDVQITKDIRSSIMDKDLSFNAKNIKIITRNEHVTLKGVVESDAERLEIVRIAGNHANQAKITDDLKVNQK